jgi:hypothetical protein
MSIKTESYSRKAFHVDAAQITAENMEEVAAWCEGEIRTGKKVIRDDNNKILERVDVSFIKVSVHRPLNERHTKGHLGDWVLLSDAGFKIYTQRAFEKAFEMEETEVSSKNYVLEQPELDVPEITLTLEGART